MFFPRRPPHTGARFGFEGLRAEAREEMAEHDVEGPPQLITADPASIDPLVRFCDQ